MIVQNVGSVDRLLRVVLGLGLILAGFLVMRGAVGTVLGVVGLIPLATGLIGWCPLYLPFRFSTKKV